MLEALVGLPEATEAIGSAANEELDRLVGLRMVERVGLLDRTQHHYFVRVEHPLWQAIRLVANFIETDGVK